MALKKILIVIAYCDKLADLTDLEKYDAGEMYSISGIKDDHKITVVIITMDEDEKVVNSVSLVIEPIAE